MEIIIPQTSGKVALRIYNPERGTSGKIDYFSVEISDPSISATARVYAYQAESLVNLFESMAQNWKGWQGVLAWASIEGEFTLSCSSDGLGHINLKIELTPSLSDDRWAVRATAATEAGQLAGLAEGAKKFFL